MLFRKIRIIYIEKITSVTSIKYQEKVKYYFKYQNNFLYHCENTSKYQFQ